MELTSTFQPFPKSGIVLRGGDNEQVGLVYTGYGTHLYKMPKHLFTISDDEWKSCKTKKDRDRLSDSKWPVSAGDFIDFDMDNDTNKVVTRYRRAARGIDVDIRATFVSQFPFLMRTHVVFSPHHANSAPECHTDMGLTEMKAHVNENVLFSTCPNVPYHALVEVWVMGDKPGEEREPVREDALATYHPTLNYWLHSFVHYDLTRTPFFAEVKRATMSAVWVQRTSRPIHFVGSAPWNSNVAVLPELVTDENDDEEIVAGPIVRYKLPQYTFDRLCIMVSNDEVFVPSLSKRVCKFAAIPHDDEDDLWPGSQIFGHVYEDFYFNKEFLVLVSYAHFSSAHHLTLPHRKGEDDTTHEFLVPLIKKKGMEDRLDTDGSPMYWNYYSTFWVRDPEKYLDDADKANAWIRLHREPGVTAQFVVTEKGYSSPYDKYEKEEKE